MSPMHTARASAGASPRRLSAAAKIVPMGRLARALARPRRAGARIVMTNGCFDLLHPGHAASLEFARAQGDFLVVGLNSDRSVRQLKGPGHPIVDQDGRAAMLAALACVDLVVVFDDASVAGLVERVLPDVLVKSNQYALEEVVGREIVEARGGRVVLSPMTGHYSTTWLIQRIQRTAVPPLRTPADDRAAA
ncbi:MAG: adenylyltransferase/cytidyltransferase family protein [Pirellulales bacterium]|nr:adenylyltransferase/cytidyltransferase family protein [Pirellulales bacterium]